MSRDRWLAALSAALIVAAAAALRVWQLDTVPLGLHNDEAWTGLNAREVLRDGWIGPYLYPSGLGQPAGPVYFTALLFTILPQSEFTLRLSMALFGIAAVAFTYAAARVMFDRTTALFAAVLLAVMPWHLHLSRTGFMVGAWPCIEMAILWALFRVREHPSALRFAAVGLLIGLGVYTYNAYPLFLPVAATPFVYDLIAARRHPDERRRWAVRSAAAGLTALWATLVMVDYAVQHEEYGWHHREVSVFYARAWRDADWPGRAGILAARGQEWAKGMVLGGRPDDGDGLGERGHPLLDPVTSLAALGGLVIAARNWRRPAYGVLLVAAVVLPLGALLTINDGLYRRTFGLAPFVALLAALSLARLWRGAFELHGVARAVVAGGVILAVAAAAARNVHAYFGPLQHTALVAYVYPYQLDAAMRVVAALPPDSTAYLFSDRWGSGFETIKWLAPDLEMVDRSMEFRKDVPRLAPLNLTADEERTTAFVLLGRYIYLVESLRELYPSAVVQEEERDGEVLYRVVRVGP